MHVVSDTTDYINNRILSYLKFFILNKLVIRSLNLIFHRLFCMLSETSQIDDGKKTNKVFDLQVNDKTYWILERKGLKVFIGGVLP